MSLILAKSWSTLITVNARCSYSWQPKTLDYYYKRLLLQRMVWFVQTQNNNHHKFSIVWTWRKIPPKIAHPLLSWRLRLQPLKQEYYTQNLPKRKTQAFLYVKSSLKRLTTTHLFASFLAHSSVKPSSTRAKPYKNDFFPDSKFGPKNTVEPTRAP